MSEETAASYVEDVDLCVFLALLLSCFVLNIRNSLHIPTSTLLMLTGLLLRSLGHYSASLKSAVEVADHINAETILLIFLPALIAECAFSTDWYTFKREITQIALLATSAVVVSSILTAIVIREVLGFSDVFGWYSALMLGAILSATDHVAVVAQLREVNADDRLETLIQGETLANEGSVIVIFHVMMEAAIGTLAEQEQIARLFFRLSFGGVALGLAFSLVLSMWLKRLIDNALLETLLTVITSYLLFFTAEATSVHVSGAIGLVTFGLYMSAYGKTLISPLIEKTFHEFWEIIGTCFECLILILGGMLMGRFLIDFRTLEYSDITSLVLLFLLLHCVRAGTIFLHWPVLRLLGYGCTFKEMIVLIVGALKGTISIALALIVYHNSSFSERIRDLVLFWSVGISALSVTLDSILLRWTIRSLGLESMSDVQENMLISVTSSILETTKKRMLEMKEDEAYAMVNWEEVGKSAGPQALFQDMLKVTKVGKRIIRAKITGSMSEILQRVGLNIRVTDEDIRVETRRRYYTTLKGLYWHQFEEGCCYGDSAVLLIESANRGLDCENQEMSDWTFIYKKIYRQKLLRGIHMFGRIPGIGRFFKSWEYRCIQSAYDVTRNFIQAHREAEELLDDMEIDINKEVFEQVMKEPHAQIAVAQQFLTENITDNYPEICIFVQTFQATSAILYSEKSVISSAYEDGVITELEFSKLSQSLDVKFDHLRSWRSPKPPSLLEMLYSCYLFQDLPKEDMSRVMMVIKEKSVKKRTIVYTDKAEITGVYVLLKGRVRETGSGYDAEHCPGDVIGPQYLLPNYLRTKTAAYTQILSTLGFIPYREINALIQSNSDFERKVWTLGLRQAIRVSRELFGELGALDPHKVNILLGNCELAKVESGQEVRLENGVILLNGRLSNGVRAFAYVKGEEKARAVTAEDCTLMMLSEELGQYIRRSSGLYKAIGRFERREKPLLKLTHSRLQPTQFPLLPTPTRTTETTILPPNTETPSKAKELLSRLQRHKPKTIVPSFPEEERLYRGSPRPTPK